MALADVIPADYNPRSITDDALAGLGASVEQFGYLQDLVFNARTGTLVAGHQRLKVLLEQGFDEAEVTVVDLDEQQERALNVTLNNPRIQGDWTADVVDLLEGMDFEVPELGDLNLDGLLDDLKLEWGDSHRHRQIEETSTPEPPAEPFTKPGDLWLLDGGRHRVLCGDSTKADDVARVMGGKLAQLMVTSPPYNQSIEKFKPSGMHKEGDWVGKVGRLAYHDTMPEAEYQAWQTAQLQMLHDTAMAECGSVFYNHKIRYRDKRVVSPYEWIPGPFSLRQEIVWSRPGSVTQNARMFLPSDERIYWMYKGKDFTFNDDTEIKSWSTVWRVGLEANHDHAVAFPVEIPTRAIIATTAPGDIMMDPFIGSGTTLIAAEQLDRRCFGIEISPNYTDVVLLRYYRLTGNVPQRKDGVDFPVHEFDASA